MQDTEKKKPTMEEKRRSWEAFVEKLKSLPPERLSKAAKWALAQEGKQEEVHIDMKAVLK